MHFTVRSNLSLIVLALAIPTTWGHFNMLLPDKASVKKGETVTFTYQWGHPFEHQLFDAPAPKVLLAFTPDGKRIDLLKSLEKITLPGADDRRVTAYRFRFTPEERGDYNLYLQTPPIWMEEEKEFVEDVVRVVLHVQVQKGWAAEPLGFDLTPVSRPYGLLPGMVFQAAASTSSSRPPTGLTAEIERYNTTPPKNLPPEEYITRTARTDPAGVLTCTLTEPGWWSLTVSAGTTPQERDGKKYPARLRRTLWVYVDEKPPSSTDK